MPQSRIPRSQHCLCGGMTPFHRARTGAAAAATPPSFSVSDATEAYSRIPTSDPEPSDSPLFDEDASVAPPTCEGRLSTASLRNQFRQAQPCEIASSHLFLSVTLVPTYIKDLRVGPGRRQTLRSAAPTKETGLWVKQPSECSSPGH